MTKPSSNERLEADKKEAYPTLARLARKFLCVPGTWQQHTGREAFSLEQEEDEHVREDCVHATILER